jgi:hypothetical protein
MKNILSICFMLSMSISFAQEKSSDVFKIFSNENARAFFLSQDNSDSKIIEFKEVVPVDFKKTNINEGKFSLKEINDKTLTTLLAELDENTKPQFLIIEEVAPFKENSMAKRSIIIATNQEFINKMIAAKIMEEGIINESLSYGDRNLDNYRNYPNMIDTLNTTYTLSEHVQVQIGDNIYPFIKKPFKTEIDKTLLSSLNLLAINF